MPRIRASIPALAGGISRPIIRSMNIWRPDGASWPSFSMASPELVRTALGERQRGLHHLPQRRRSCGCAPASASLK